MSEEFKQALESWNAFVARMKEEALVQKLLAEWRPK